MTVTTEHQPVVDDILKGSVTHQGVHTPRPTMTAKEAEVAAAQKVLLLLHATSDEGTKHFRADHMGWETLCKRRT